MGRTMPTVCSHGVFVDWGDFGPEDGPSGDTCPACETHPKPISVAAADHLRAVEAGRDALRVGLSRALAQRDAALADVARLTAERDEALCAVKVVIGEYRATYARLRAERDAAIVALEATT